MTKFVCPVDVMFHRMYVYEQQLLLMKREKAPKYYNYDLSLVMKVTSTQILNLTLISNIQIQNARYLVRVEILNVTHLDTPA
jgi:hypothetical protein